MKIFLLDKVLSLFVLMVLFTTAQGDPIDTSYTYQGELIVNGQPANGQYEFKVDLYDQESNGALVQTQSFLTNDAITVTDGLFSLKLGLSFLSLSGDKLWLELQTKPVSGNSFETLLPRHLIATTPFASYALSAEFATIVGANGVDAQALKDNIISSSHIINLAITNPKIADNAITTNKIAPNSIVSNQLQADSVSSTKIIDGTIISSDIANGTIIATNVDTSSIQQRVSGTCAAGSSIRSIDVDGTVTCETDDTGTTGWGLTGNSGTTTGTNFIGTTDDNDFIIKVNNIEAMRIAPGRFGSTTPNYKFGYVDNYIYDFASGSVISGGGISTLENKITESHGVIAGGLGNVLGNNNTDYLDGIGSVISGGGVNLIGFSSTNLSYSTIGGGQANQIDGAWSTIPGGLYNHISADYSFAAGFAARAIHSGSFVWNDRSDTIRLNGMETTGNNQFLIRAEGGVGIGTNDPSSPFHLKGRGTNIGTLPANNEVVMTIETVYPTESAAISIRRANTSVESSLLFTTGTTPEFDIRNTAAGELLIEYYFDNGGGLNKIPMMRFEQGELIYLQSIMLPEIDNTFDIGTTDNRWKTVFTTNIDSVNAIKVTSDKRLKANIVDLEYGLSEVLSMRPVSYNMKKGDTKQLHLGLIAQEVEIIVPEVVSKKSDKAQTRSMRYSELIPVLIKATQEQQILIEHQNTTIKQQSQDILELKKMVQKLLD